VSNEETARALLDEAARVKRIEEGVLVVREGHGANCSSIGSVIDTLFATAVVGGAVLAAVAAALAREDVRIVGNRSPREAAAAKDEKSPAEEPPR
jgi:hypothetical protein